MSMNWRIFSIEFPKEGSRLRGQFRVIENRSLKLKPLERLWIWTALSLVHHHSHSGNRERATIYNQTQ